MTISISGLLFFVLIIFLLVLPAWRMGRLRAARIGAIRALEQKRGSRVIVLIHRQETVGLAGYPVFRYIDIEDSEQLLRAIKLTDDDVPIDIILHTPGGLVLADISRKSINQVKNMVARILENHPNIDQVKAQELAELLATGTWTHDYPILVSEALEMGLPVSTDMPEEVYDLMDMYGQAGQKRPTVSYIPMPYQQPQSSDSGEPTKS